MTDIQPMQDGSQNARNGAAPGDDPQNRDSLQQQARHETSKAEGERSSFQDENGENAGIDRQGSRQDDPQQDPRSQGPEQV